MNRSRLNLARKADDDDWYFSNQNHKSAKLQMLFMLFSSENETITSEKYHIFPKSFFKNLRDSQKMCGRKPPNSRRAPYIT